MVELNWYKKDMANWMNYLQELKLNFLCVKSMHKGAFALKISSIISA